MDDCAIAARLERDDSTPTVAAFPDGSVDTFYDVTVGQKRVATQTTFARNIESEHIDAFTLHRKSTRPGGHAVNLAGQANHLGNDVTLAGHLDDSAFAELSFNTVSLGEPATVSIYEFDDGDVLAVENSTALETWMLEDLRDVLGNDFTDFVTADAVCCANWASIEALPSALSSLAATDPDGAWFLIDPGTVAGRSERDFEQLFDSLECLTDAYEVVLAANPREVDGMATGLGQSADDIESKLRNLREKASLTGVVVHGESRAAVVTADGFLTNENFDVEPTQHTGGGDRFDAGLVHALVREWEWSDALRLGNACASHYIATGESGTQAELATFLRGHHA